MDAMSRALQKVARSSFSNEIELAEMPDRFTRPPFNCYNGKTDLVEHVSHYIQMMSLHTHNDALMCKVFPSSLGPTALRWFNGLRKGSICSFSELIQEFGVPFVTQLSTSAGRRVSLNENEGGRDPSIVTPAGIGSYIMR